MTIIIGRLTPNGPDEVIAYESGGHRFTRDDLKDGLVSIWQAFCSTSPLSEGAPPVEAK